MKVLCLDDHDLGSVFGRIQIHGGSEGSRSEGSRLRLDLRTDLCLEGSNFSLIYLLGANIEIIWKM